MKRACAAVNGRRGRLDPSLVVLIESAADEAGTFAALFAAMGGVPDPVFTWFAATPRKWHGYTFPGSRWFADNTDTLYRAARVDERATYEITLRVGKSLPAQLSFLTYNWLMLETGGGAQDDVPLSAIEIKDSTPRNADGTITIVASAAGDTRTDVVTISGATGSTGAEVR